MTQILVIEVDFPVYSAFRRSIVDDFIPFENTLATPARGAGEEIVGLSVPAGKVWLFPKLGTNRGYDDVEKFIKGQRLSFEVDI